MSDLLARLAQWRSPRILVFGDYMLDELVYGDAERLTGDAPVPILRVRRTERMPGGAANVCMNLIALNATVHAFGIVGNDTEGTHLRSELESSGVRCDGLLIDPNRPTTVKRNLIGLAQHRHPQKMFRLDQESDDPIDEAILRKLLGCLEELLPTIDLIAIEDYNKGVCCERLCQAVIERARASDIPVIVDPASISDFGRYRRATAITPNRSEAEKATGMRTPAEPDLSVYATLAKAIQDSTQIDVIVLTLDRHGALLLNRSGEPQLLPTVARQVYDVTGAGDMVLAALAAARANGVDWPGSVQFANAAAGLEVEVFGVRPIPFERVYHSLLTQGRQGPSKLRTVDEAMIEVAATRREGKKVVFTNGCFDMLHGGHVSLLRKAASLGDLLVVAINSDESVARLKGPERPVYCQEDRVNILNELESVGIVMIYDDDTPIPLLERLKPDILVKGADYGHDQVVGWEVVESYGGQVVLVDFLRGRSTTDAIRKIQTGRQ